MERFQVLIPFLWTVLLQFFLWRETALLIKRDVHQDEWENMHFNMNQSMKRRGGEEEEGSVIRHNTKEFDFFF